MAVLNWRTWIESLWAQLPKNPMWKHVRSGDYNEDGTPKSIYDEKPNTGPATPELGDVLNEHRLRVPPVAKPDKHYCSSDGEVDDFGAHRIEEIRKLVEPSEE